MSALEAPADATFTGWPAGPGQCPSDSPWWGYSGEGERCQRPKGHDGPHWFEGGECVMQWIWKPGHDLNA